MNLSLRTSTAIAVALSLTASPTFADMDAAMEFLDNEIAGLSVLSRAEQ